MIKIILALAIGLSVISCGHGEEDAIDITNGGETGRTGRDGKDGYDGRDGKDGKDGKDTKGGKIRYVIVCELVNYRWYTKYIETNDYVADYLDKTVKRFRLGACR